ncbi:hypothetical protein BaRGS_00025070, partial [Batillaria attramentaria]
KANSRGTEEQRNTTDKMVLESPGGAPYHGQVDLPVSVGEKLTVPRLFVKY